MKIKNVIIENFRNLKYLEFNVNGNSVISGKNNIGKSNALNALVWFFSDTIYTDNLGIGENDINSICPKDQVKGEHTSVSVEFVDGPTFKKVYKTGYDRETKKANKHTTEGYINNVLQQNISKWNKELFFTLNYKPYFESVKEINLFIDPLYAFLKLPASQLRALLVDFGCTASNEELFNLGFEDLRKYEKKYLGNYVDMRIDLKKQIKSINELLDKTTILFEQYNAIEEFDEAPLLELNKRIESLNISKNNLLHDENSAIKEFEIKLKEIKNNIELELTKKVNDLKLEVRDLENKKSLEQEKINNSQIEKTKEIKDEIKQIERELLTLDISLSAYLKAKTSFKSNLESTQLNAKSAIEQKKDAMVKLNEARIREYSNYVICPNCGEHIVPNEEDKANFDSRKNKDIKFFTNEINRLNNVIKNYTDNINSIINNSKETNVEIEKINKLKLEYNEKLINLKMHLNDVINEPVDMSSIIELDSKIDELKKKIVAIPKADDNEQIVSLKAKIEQLKLNNDTALNEQVSNINSQIKELEVEREELYIKRSNWKQKIEYQNQLEDITERLNDTEALLIRVNDFIHTMINLINSKAKKLTGIDFVMIEENLGNDNVKEVCYATYEGVPFANLNTARKYEIGIQFIEKAKNIASSLGAGHNDLPILADKFEGIDSIDKIKNLTTEQLICTRVSDQEEITIL